jgi:hypothetical protein
MGRGFAPGMDGLDGGLSVRCMGRDGIDRVAAVEQREAAFGSGRAREGISRNFWQCGTSGRPHAQVLRRLRRRTQPRAARQLLQGTWCRRLLLMLQQFMSRIAIFPLGSRPYSCRAFTVNSLEARSDGV